MIRIRKPLCFSEIGRKDNQEDYLFPSNADKSTRVFILCDGMGGHDNGEVASRTAAKALGEYLTSCSKIDSDIFKAGLSKAYDALDSIDTSTDRKPGTTMTALCINDDSYVAAHIGDSRIYHIRPSLYNKDKGMSGLVYQSYDHSLVNDLLKAGELTEEEAKDFPQKNIITRAMQPHLAKRYKADIIESDDIKSGDYFFLCCDGVLEQLTNEALCEIIADKTIDDSKKLAKIKSICDGKTKDNYTCWLIPIDKVEINKSISDKTDEIVLKADLENQEEKTCHGESIEHIELTPNENDNIIAGNKSQKQRLNDRLNRFLPEIRFRDSKIKRLYIVLAAVISVALLAYGAYWIYSKKENSNPVKIENKTIIKKSKTNPGIKKEKPKTDSIDKKEEKKESEDVAEKSDSNEKNFRIPFRLPLGK